MKISDHFSSSMRLDERHIDNFAVASPSKDHFQLSLDLGSQLVDDVQSFEIVGDLFRLRRSEDDALRVARGEETGWFISKRRVVQREPSRTTWENKATRLTETLGFERHQARAR